MPAPTRGSRPFPFPHPLDTTSPMQHPPPIPATSPETRIPVRLGGQPVPSKWAVTFKRDVIGQRDDDERRADSDERMWPKLPTSKQHKSIAERRNRPALRVQTGGLSKAAHAQQQLHATFARGSTPSSPTVITFTAREEDTWTPRPPPAPTGASFIIRRAPSYFPASGEEVDW
ncbi:hypothetical protein K438DRAFT_1774460 [Mycena galopus ATCC 62051]|nr:hypothetical protein K438DRAFT_1774460 [Mycena galopus ATCC 62051]